MPNNKQNSFDIDYDEWNSLIPITLLSGTKDENGNFYIKTPRKINKLIKILFKPFLPQNPTQTIHFDPIGSKVWEMCDGVNTIEHICLHITKLMPDENDINKRIIIFLDALNKQKLISLYKKG